jgi:hypothetical protein
MAHLVAAAAAVLRVLFPTTRKLRVMIDVNININVITIIMCGSKRD